MECKLLTKATAAQVADVQNSLSKKYDVLVSTPARVVSLLQARALDLSTVQVCIIDEADKLFEDGFVAQIDEVLAGCTHKRLQKALFSATIPPSVEELAKSIMPNPATVTIGKKVGASTSISQKLVYCGTEEGKIVALRNLVAAGLKPPVLVFVQSVERAKQLFRCMYLSYIYTYITY
jgi:ATP-dependent RNA helicase DDX52/ROK1